MGSALSKQESDFQGLNISWVLYVPGMVLDGVAKIKHASLHLDTYKIKQYQDSVMTEESQADSWEWGEACR